MLQLTANFASGSKRENFDGLMSFFFCDRERETGRAECWYTAYFCYQFDERK